MAKFYLGVFHKNLLTFLCPYAHNNSALDDKSVVKFGFQRSYKN